ncbi:MAG: membrane protein insertase YidC [Alphaproteobacteria bacterium]
MNEQRNLIIFVLFFIGVMWAWDYFYAPNVPVPVEQAQQQPAQPQVAQPSAPTAVISRDQALTLNQRLTVKSDTLQGSINLQGARIDDLRLLKYKETTDADSKTIALLHPAQSSSPYFAQFGWVSNDKSIAVPDNNAQWQADKASLSPGETATLTWENATGQRFEQRITLDDQYVFTVTQRVYNDGAQALTFFPYARLTRTNVPETSGNYILHEGPLGVLNGKLVEHKYDDLNDAGEIRSKSNGGWAGITDKYWLAAFIPGSKLSYDYFFQNIHTGPQDTYLTGYYGQPVVISPGQSSEVTDNFFAGPKVLDMLDAYEAKLNTEHFDLAVDFGWFYFITKPFFQALTAMHEWFGNFGIGILLLTVLLKLLFFPLANKSYRSMARMKKLQPKMEKLKERYKDDKLKMNQELMNLYKKEKVNPMAGCLPIVIQIPVFFALYKVLFISIEMRHAPFYGWIHDLSAPDPTSIFNLFGVIPWDPPSMLMIGVWPIIMGLTMFIQQKLNPTPSDPVQEKMFMIMPVMLTFLLSNFAAGLVIYWAWNNVLSIIQQWAIMKSSK